MNQITSEQFNTLVPVVANDEIRALMVAVVGLREIEGQEPAWWPVDRSLCLRRQAALDYDRITHPTGYSTPRNIGHEGTVTHVLSRLGKTGGLAIAGAVLDWSLQHPDVSLDTMFGRSNAQTDYQTPIHRFELLEKLLAIGDAGILYTELKDQYPDKPFADVAKQLAQGAFAPFVTVGLEAPEFNPQLTITHGQYHGSKAFEQLTPERQFIYKTMAKLSKQGSVDISLEDFVSKVVYRRRGINPEKVREIVVKATATDDTHMPGLYRAEGEEIGHSGRHQQTTRIKIKPEGTDIVSTLLTNVRDATTTPGYEHFRAQAFAIAGNSEDCLKLVDKVVEMIWHVVLDVSGNRLAQ